MKAIRKVDAGFIPSDGRGMGSLCQFFACCLPPRLSGGQVISISEEPVEIYEGLLTLDDRFGADQRFLGVVRGMENGRRIAGIRYTCYGAMATRVMEDICDQMTAGNEEHRVLIHHRIGFVAAGEASIVIRVQTRHSREAFALCQEYLRRVKTEVPICKEPVWETAG